MTLNHLSTALMADELGRLGFKDPERSVHSLYPHSIGHYIGLDLHDCPKAPLDMVLQPEMVLTVEPGLYIPSDPRYPERYHGIGIRIEDDILVTSKEQGGVRILTEAVPKHPEEIEQHLGARSR